mgnify:CR=1 FL=1
MSISTNLLSLRDIESAVRATIIWGGFSKVPSNVIFAIVELKFSQEKPFKSLNSKFP